MTDFENSAAARAASGRSATIRGTSISSGQGIYRFSLERQIRKITKDSTGTWRRDRATLGEAITSKSAAEAERDRLRAVNSRFGSPPVAAASSSPAS